jgi:glutamate-1-semialdehyde 2,1-aminomutase
MKIGAEVQRGWKNLAIKHDLSIDIGGIPPLSHFSFKAENSQVIKAVFVTMMLDRGFLASTSFYSMYAHTLGHVEQYLKEVDEVFSELTRLLRADTIESRLVGQPATSGFKRLL